MSTQTPPVEPGQEVEAGQSGKISITLSVPSQLIANNGVRRNLVQIGVLAGIVFSVFLPAYSFGSYGLDSSTSMWAIAKSAYKPLFVAPFWMALILIAIKINQYRLQLVGQKIIGSRARLIQAIVLLLSGYMASHGITIWVSLVGSYDFDGSSLNIGLGVFLSMICSLINVVIVTGSFITQNEI